MQRDAHYYAVLAFARGCGFTKKAAHTIAYASQYVDDAKVNHIVLEGQSKSNSRSLLDMATSHQYLHAKTLNYSAIMNNTCAFHFVPGCEGDNIARKFRCKEDSKVIRSIVEEALKDDDLVKFGMVLHPFADSFSHQGFAGIPSKVNDIIKPRIRSPLLSINRLYDNEIRLFFRSQLRKFDLAIPPYGHGQALSNPDMAHVVWSYRYDKTPPFTAVNSGVKKKQGYRFSPINNIDRYTRAFRRIKKYLELYLNDNRHEKYRDHDFFDKDGIPKFKRFDVLFETLVEDTGIMKSKETKWKKVLTSTKLFDEKDKKIYIEYDKHKWARDAFANYDEKKSDFNRREVTGVVPRGELKNSDWYRYYKAVKWYKPLFYKCCRDNGLYIPNDYQVSDSGEAFSLVA